MSVTTTLSSLLSRNTSRPGVVGTARVDRDIDRLLRRVCPGDIAVLDVLDLDRITADALVDAEIAAVINASPSVSGRYPNLGLESAPLQRWCVRRGPPADPRHRAHRRRDRRVDAGSQEWAGRPPGSVRRQ